MRWGLGQPGPAPPLERRPRSRRLNDNVCALRSAGQGPVLSRDRVHALLSGPANVTQRLRSPFACVALHPYGFSLIDYPL